MNSNLLNTFLYYGYIPSKSLFNFDSWLPYSANEIEKLKTQWKNISKQEIIDFGSLRLQEIIDANVTKQNIVPLSGGLDSRAVLGLLLQHYPKSKIKTVTVGMPGTYDYEIGRLVASTFNFEAAVIDLRTVVWRTEDLVRFADTFKSPILLIDAFLFSKAYEFFKKERSVYWSGFLGEVLTGSHLPKTENSEWNAICKQFSKSRQATEGEVMSEPGFNPLKCLPNSSIIDKSIISGFEQVDMTVRQRQFIMPQVLPEAYGIKTPFLNTNWVNFCLSLPLAFRKNQILYKKILQQTFPDLFKLPTKNSAGLPLAESKGKKYVKKARLKARKWLRNKGILNEYKNPKLNYLDFAEEFRKNSLKKVTRENLDDLKKRNIVNWINIEEIWRLHQSKKKDLSKALALLLSLEINIKAGNFE